MKKRVEVITWTYFVKLLYPTNKKLKYARRVSEKERVFDCEERRMEKENVYIYK